MKKVHSVRWEKNYNEILKNFTKDDSVFSKSVEGNFYYKLYIHV